MLNHGAARLGQKIVDADGDILGAQHGLLADHLTLLLCRNIGILEIGTGLARLDQRDLDAFWPKFLAQCFGEASYTGLHSRVDGRSCP